MSTEVNPVLSAAEDAFQNGIWNTIISVEVDALCVSNPILVFLKPAIKSIALYLAGFLFAKIKLFVDISAIKLIDNEANQAFKDASIKLAVVAESEGINSNDYYKAKASAEIALSKFVRFNT
jgi:hypothetical protein